MKQCLSLEKLCTLRFVYYYIFCHLGKLISSIKTKIIMAKCMVDIYTLKKYSTNFDKNKLKIFQRNRVNKNDIRT